MIGITWQFISFYSLYFKMDGLFAINKFLKIQRKQKIKRNRMQQHRCSGQRCLWTKGCCVAYWPLFHSFILSSINYDKRLIFFFFLFFSFFSLIKIVFFPFLHIFFFTFNKLKQHNVFNSSIIIIIGVWSYRKKNKK